MNIVLSVAITMVFMSILGIVMGICFKVGDFLYDKNRYFKAMINNLIGVNGRG